MAADVDQARSLIKGYCDRRGIVPHVDDDGDLSWELFIPIEGAEQPLSCFCSAVSTDMGPGRVSVSMVSGLNQPFPSERYWDTLDLLNKVNVANETGVAYVVTLTDGLPGLGAKALWVGDFVSEVSIGYLCSAVAMEMKNALPVAVRLWAGELTVPAALEEYWG